MTITTKRAGVFGALRWLAVVPATIGLVIGFFGLVWTEWPQLLAACGLLAVSAAIWWAFDRTGQGG